MKEHEFLDGVSHIESDIVESFVAMDNRLQRRAHRSKSQRAWMRVGAVAACLAVIVGAIIAVPVLRVITRPAVPTWDNPPYTAEEISKLFPMTLEGAATNAYTKVYVPDAKYLYIDEIPDDDYMNIYGYREIENELNQEEFKAFIDGILPPLADSLQVNTPHYSIETDYDGDLAIHTDTGTYNIYAFQTTDKYGVSLRLRGDWKIKLDGETVQIDQRQSDEEILESIASIRDKLYSIFNVSFPDVKIVRQYDSYSEYGVGDIEIYFFDEAAHPLNVTAFRTRPVSDYLCINFDNHKNFAGDIVSDGVLTVADVWYHQTRNDVTDEYSVIAEARRISLKEAEALLYNGYMFGGHSCPLCMAAQDKVSFDGYDFVDMEYVFGGDTKTGNPLMALPFYAFYKKIGTSENGNSIYAKTYVAAIEVGGYEEYFNSQKDEHKNTGAFDFD